MPDRARRDALAEAEQYYSTLWADEEWGGAQANADEALRAEGILRLIEQNVVAEHEPSRALDILDLGCGRGWLTAKLAVYGHVIGIDPVCAAVHRARQLFPHLTFLVSNGSDLPTLSGDSPSFDLIVASEVIEHVADAHKADFMDTIRHLLRPGGHAILTTPRGELWHRWKAIGIEEQPIEEWLTEKQMGQLSSGAGLAVVAKERIFLPGFVLHRSGRLVASRYFQRLVKRFPHSSVLLTLKHWNGFYQLVVLKRPS